MNASRASAFVVVDNVMEEAIGRVPATYGGSFLVFPLLTLLTLLTVTLKLCIVP